MFALTPQSTTSLTTDQTDYAPRSTANIAASGFAIGAELEFTIEVIDPETHGVLWTGPVWRAVDDGPGDGDNRADGTVLTQFYVTRDYLDTTIRLTAVDVATGQRAVTIFTDSSGSLSDCQDGRPETSIPFAPPSASCSTASPRRNAQTTSPTRSNLKTSRSNAGKARRFGIGDGRKPLNPNLNPHRRSRQCVRIAPSRPLYSRSLRGTRSAAS